MYSKILFLDITSSRCSNCPQNVWNFRSCLDYPGNFLFSPMPWWMDRISPLPFFTTVVSIGYLPTVSTIWTDVFNLLDNFYQQFSWRLHFSTSQWMSLLLRNFSVLFSNKTRNVLQKHESPKMLRIYFTRNKIRCIACSFGSSEFACSRIDWKIARKYGLKQKNWHWSTWISGGKVLGKRVGIWKSIQSRWVRG